FNAFDDLLDIRKMAEMSMEQLITKVNEQISLIQKLRPTGYTLAKMDNELAIMTLLRSLPYDEYQVFLTTLRISSEDLTITEVEDVFRKEE
ncbi:hypothetical protein BT69DRAFT_1201342, partial [Atractiella rhizophila]